MAIDIKFSFVCEKQFQDLKGDNDQVRFCEKCQYQVFNLDPLTDEQRLRLFEDASKNNKKICISTTLPIENKVSCSEVNKTPKLPPPIPPSRPTAGMPVMPTPNELAQERALVEKLKQQSWWKKLKFW